MSITPTPKKRLLGLVNPRTPEGTLKDPAQVFKQMKAQIDAKRDDDSK